jgi:hypothetical protein
LLFVATTVVGVLLAPHPKGPQPSALGDFSVPTAQEGRAIPIVFGTCLIKGGNTVWWGDLKSTKILSGGGIMELGRTQTVGYKYFLGCQFVLCHGPVDALVDIQADQKSVKRTASVVLNAGTGTENYIDVEANAPNLFGGTGPGGGGGIKGGFSFYRGLETQLPDDYLTAKQGRVVTDQSGIDYAFVGTGNGGITALSAGSHSIEETITVTAIGIDANTLHVTFGKMKFNVHGSISGDQANTSANADGSVGCWADAAFSCSRINLTVQTGSTQYVNGDQFTIGTLHATVAPAYRGICYVVFRQPYVGTSNYLKPLAFAVRRCPDPLAQGAGVANIGGDANPALAVYDLLTNVRYGLQIPPSLVDPTSFMAAAVTLAAEGLGISMMFDTQATADSLIGEVLRHCDGLIYTDPQTGLFHFVLARGGYDPTTLPVLTVDSVIGTPDFSRGSWSETTNLVHINFSSRANNYEDRLVKAYDAANIKVTGEVRSQTIDFKGISSEAAAALVAIRVLKTFTYPLAKMKIVADRSAWKLRPGGLFRFTWVPLGVVNQVFRITRISYGELTDGKISMDVVEDIFGISSVAFVAPPLSGWVNPAGAATPCSAQQLVELPYLIQQRESLPLGIYALAMAARDPAVNEKSFEIWINPGSGFGDSGILSSFCPVGLLNATYAAGLAAFDSTGFVLSATGGVDLDELAAASATDFASGVNLCMIDNEIMAWTTPTLNSDGTYSIAGVARGLLDTVPANHASGAKVFFFSLGANVTQPTPYASDLTVTARFTPNSAIDQLAVTAAADVTLTTRSRSIRPYPPGNISVNGRAYGVRPATVAGDFTVSWKSRNRLTQALTVQQDAADIAGETGQFFTVQKKIAGVAVGPLINVGSSESFTYGAAQRGVDDPDFTKLTTLEIYSNAGTVPLASYFPQVVSTLMFGTATTLPSPGRYEFSGTEVGGLLL